MKEKINKMIFIELGLIILVLIIYLVAKSNLINVFPKCIINDKLGILCPSCGGTRTVISFFNGNFIESFYYNKLFFITIIYLIFINIIYIINSFKKKEILTFLYPKFRFWIIFCVAILIFTIVRNIV